MLGSTSIEVSELANVVGTKWGSNQLGTPGGTVTWSIAAAGTDISRFGVSTQQSVSGNSFLTYDFAQVIADQFAAWSQHGDIEFQQVADQGGAAGVGADADIRIFFGEIPGGTAGYAFYPSAWGSAIAGDILLDTLSAFNSDPALFAAVVLHEIGHALGLGHVSENSIMTPTVRKIGLQADDIAGIQEIYGVQDGAAPHDDGCDCPDCCNEGNDSHDDHDNHDGHNHSEDDAPPVEPLLDGNDNNNKIVATSGSDVMNGFAGDDTLKGKDGDDTLNGGDGADRLKGGKDNDVLSGQNSEDTLKGNSGDDMLNGGSGSDTLKGGTGDDTLNGGTGDDKLVGRDDNDTFVFADGHGHDNIKGFEARNDAEKIDLSGVSALSSFADVLAAATQDGKHVYIDTGADSSIRLSRVDLADLDAGDFLF